MTTKEKILDYISRVAVCFLTGLAVSLVLGMLTIFAFILYEASTTIEISRQQGAIILSCVIGISWFTIFVGLLILAPSIHK
jgi:hypothetical protein